MKKIVAFVLLFAYSSSFACTTFLLTKNGQYVFGRNYDWVTGNGMIMVNKRGLLKKSLEVEVGKQIQWTSVYGSISFNQYGKEFPMGGMNEKGLVVELMWLDDTKYPAKDDRAALDVLQWIQYQLDCAATIEDVIDSDKQVRITNDNATPLHYLIADAAGNAATIEFLEGKMVVHKGNDLPLPVLTNSLYTEALKYTQDIKKTEARSFTDNSLARFSIACNMLKKFQQPEQKSAPVDYAFSILNNVAQGDFTKWSIVYDISNKQIHFITDKNKNRRNISIDQFNFNCSTPLTAYNLSASDKGSVNSHFKPLDMEQNKSLILKSVHETGPRITVTTDEITETVNHFNSPKCK
jgi:choloylglycine hydrolase